jgi:Protein of unknown function (DUF4065)
MSMTERAKAKRVIAAMVKHAGGTFTGKTRLFKAFYIAHLLYAEQQRGYLTNWPIVRMPHGPGIDGGDELIAELELSGILELHKVPEGPWSTTRYRLTGDERGGDKLSSAETRAIKQAVEFVRKKTASELSELTHEHSRSWIGARDGQPLDIYIDMIPDDEFERREREIDAVHRELLAAWK